MEDRIAKKKLNIILLVDTSTSMRGARIEQVNDAVKEITTYLTNQQSENTEVDFDITLLSFATNAELYNDQRCCNIADFDFKGLPTGGWTNLHLAYKRLKELMVPAARGGIMPDYGGLAPIVLLLTDGHPTKNLYYNYLKDLEKLPWFNHSLKFAVAIGLNDTRTMSVLEDFTKNKATVLTCLDSDALKEIIKVIVITTSMVKSKHSVANQTEVSVNEQIIQQVTDNIENAEQWGW